MKVCPNCNAQLNDDAMFCGNCGAQFAAPQNPQGGYQQPQPNGYTNQQYQPQMPYGQPPYGQKPNDGKGMSIAALVLGICGLVIPWAGFVASILGIVFGIIGRSKSVACYGRASGMATAGLVTGIVGTAFGLIWIIACVSCADCISCGLCGSSNALRYYY